MSGELEFRLREIVEVLCNKIGPRSIYNYNALRESAEYIKNQIKSYGLDFNTQIYSVSAGKNVENIMVFLNGAPEKPYYLVGAHYDTVNTTPGADDNASAVAVTLEVLRAVVGKVKKPVAFVFFTLEEPPFFGTPNMGSRRFVSWAKRNKHVILGALVLEMVGYYCYTPGCQKAPPFIRFIKHVPDTGDFIGIIGDSKSKALVKKLTEAFSRVQGLKVETLVVPVRGFILPQTRLSDNASFWDKGYPAVMITDTAYFRNPYYHTPFDTPEKLDYQKMALLVEGIKEFLLRF